MASKVLIDNYLENNKIYSELFFSNSAHINDPLPNLFIFTQYLIDQFIAQNEKRIAIVLPSDDWDIYPLIFAKAISNFKREEQKRESIIYSIKKGQKLRLGKAVVQFDSIDKDKNKISFIVGKTDQMKIMYPITKFVDYLEKCDGQLSTFETWTNELKEVNYAINNKLDIVKNRTSGKSTLILLTSKTNFRESTNQIKINEQEVQYILTFGEIDFNSTTNFKIGNRGRLDCLPSIGISAKISEVSELLDKTTDYNCINSIYITNDKLNEVINYSADLINCLKTEIPLIIFLSESNFETSGKLMDYGFKIWHWKPSTINNKIFIQTNFSNKGVFGNIPRKIKNAAIASFSTKTIQVEQFKKNLSLIKQLFSLTEGKEENLRHIVHKIWVYQNNLKAVSFTNNRIYTFFLQELSQIKEKWQLIAPQYKGQELYDVIEYLINSYSKNVKQQISYKEKLIKELLEDTKYTDKQIAIILPDREFYDSFGKKDFEISNTFKQLDILTLSHFFKRTESNFNTYDFILVTWFDSFNGNEYLKIKQTYCYKNLNYILFDFENKWRNGLIKKIDSYIPHSEVIKNGKAIGLTKQDYLDSSFDFDEKEEIDEKYAEVNDLQYSRDILNYAIQSVTEDSSDLKVECIPMLLSNGKIAYFHPEHTVIDITDLLIDHNSNPSKKEANKLCKGDCIIIRQSGKDIIHEKADELMKLNHEEGLREKAEKWISLLQELASVLSIKDMVNEFKLHGVECTYTQIRFWLTGELICPRSQQTLFAIAYTYLNYFNEFHIDKKIIEEIGTIYNAGKKIQTYHQQAGRWLTKELKEKVKEIKAIAKKKEGKGSIEGIGEITLYKIEDILEKIEISKNNINRIEELY